MFRRLLAQRLQQEVSDFPNVFTGTAKKRLRFPIDIEHAGRSHEGQGLETCREAGFAEHRQRVRQRFAIRKWRLSDTPGFRGTSEEYFSYISWQRRCAGPLFDERAFCFC